MNEEIDGATMRRRKRVDNTEIEEAVADMRTLKGEYSRPLVSGGTGIADLGVLRGEFTQSWVPVGNFNSLMICVPAALTWKVSMFVIAGEAVTLDPFVVAGQTIIFVLGVNSMLVIPFPATGTSSVASSPFQLSRSMCAVSFGLDQTSVTSTALTASCTVGAVPRPGVNALSQTSLGTNTMDPKKRKLGITLGKGNGITMCSVANSGLSLYPAVGKMTSRYAQQISTAVGSAAVGRYMYFRQYAFRVPRPPPYADGPGILISPYVLSEQMGQYIMCAAVEPWEKHVFEFRVRLPAADAAFGTLVMSLTALDTCINGSTVTPKTTVLSREPLVLIDGVEGVWTKSVTVGPADGTMMFTALWLSLECFGGEFTQLLYADIAQGLPCDAATDSPVFVARIDNIAAGQQVTVREKYIEEGNVEAKAAVNVVPFMQPIKKVLNMEQWAEVTRRFEDWQVASTEEFEKESRQATIEAAKIVEATR